MHLTQPVMVFTVWLHHVAVIVFAGALGVCVFRRVSSEWLFEIDKSLFSCLTKYLASVLMVLWLNKAPFNSLFCAYSFSTECGALIAQEYCV